MTASRRIMNGTAVKLKFEAKNDDKNDNDVDIDNATLIPELSVGRACIWSYVALLIPRTRKYSMRIY